MGNLYLKSTSESTVSYKVFKQLLKKMDRIKQASVYQGLRKQQNVFFFPAFFLWAKMMAADSFSSE